MKTKAVTGIRRKLFRRVLYNYKINLTPRLTCGGEFAILSNAIGVLEIYQIEVIRLWLAKQLKKYRAKLFVRSVLRRLRRKRSRHAWVRVRVKLSIFFVGLI